MRVELGENEEGRIEVIFGIEHLVTFNNRSKNTTYWIGASGTILHRENGPAIIFPDGNKAWYLNNEIISEAEFNKILAKKRLKNIL